MYINDTTQEQRSYQDIKADNPNTSIPADGVDVILDIWYFINPTEQPPYNSDTQKLEEGLPVKTLLVYNQVWDTIPLSQQEMDDDLLQAQESMYSQVWQQYDSMVDGIAQTGVTGNDDRKTVTLAKKSDKRLTKKSKGQSLTTKEEEDEEWYDNWLDWSDDNHDAADSACDDIELMTLPSVVNAYDVVNDPDWVPYTAP